MKSPAFLISICESTWRGTTLDTFDLPAQGGQLDPPTALAVVQAMREHGYAGQPVALGIPSDWTFVAEISTHNLPRGNRQQAMLYRMEEQLPIPAETLTADFAVRANHALGVAIETERLLTIIRELRTAGILVQSICPTALWALQALANRSNDPEPCHVLLDLDDNWELAYLEGRSLRSWKSVAKASGTDALLREVRATLMQCHASTQAHTLLAAGIDPAVMEFLGSIEELRPETVEGFAPMAAAALSAQAALAGHAKGWIDLCHGPLGAPDRLVGVRRPLNVLIACAAIFLAILAIAGVCRTIQYRSHVRQLQEQQAAIFHGLYPNQAAPPAVFWRLESEAKRLSGMRGTSANLPDRPSALDALRQIVAALPGNVRLSLSEIRIEPGGVLLEGLTRSHGDAETLAAEIRRAKAFAVESPKTEQLAKEGVSFSITATPAPTTRKAQP